MGLRVDIPGLDRVAPEVPDGALVVLEGGADPGKGRILHALASRSAQDQRRPHLFLSKAPMAQEETAGVPHTLAERLEDLQSFEGDVFVDSLSMLALGVATRDLVAALRELRIACKRHQTIAVVTLDQGMLDGASRSAVHHLADGLVLLLSREDDDGVARYLQIPKWPGGTDRLRNVYYEVLEDQVVVDTRDRVS